MTGPTSPRASPESGDPRKDRESALPGAGVLGMWILLATLAVLFAASITGYLVVRAAAPRWPPAGMPRLPSGLWVATAVILLCSAAVHRALVDVRRGQRAASALWLRATFALGLVFLAVQAWNWRGLVDADLGLRTRNLYAFTFYMLTGLHAAHVIGGLVLLAIVARRASRGSYGSGHHPGVVYAAMYWHFLDAIWLLLFAVLVVFV